MTETTDARAAPVTTTAWPRRLSTPSAREAIWGFVFIGPWLIGLALFTAGPIIASLIISLTDFNLVRPEEVKFIGLDNYVEMASDPNVVQSLLVTFKFAIIAIPLTMVASLGLAVLVNSPKLFGRNIFRTLLYMPIQIPLVASTLVWIGFLNTETGWLNGILGSFGLTGPDWINSETWIYPALSLIGLWGIGNFMLINIAGLQSVPTELYEAARIDGAGAWKTFRRITIPLMSPILLYNLRHLADRDVPVLHPGLHDDERPRRPEQRDAVHQPRPLPRGVRLQPDGLRRGHRLAAVRHRAHPDRGALRLRPEARLLRGR